jgi:hypothetical protein
MYDVVTRVKRKRMPLHRAITLLFSESSGYPLDNNVRDLRIKKYLSRKTPNVYVGTGINYHKIVTSHKPHLFNKLHSFSQSPHIFHPRIE